MLCSFLTIALNNDRTTWAYVNPPVAHGSPLDSPFVWAREDDHLSAAEAMAESSARSVAQKNSQIDGRHLERLVDVG